MPRINTTLAAFALLACSFPADAAECTVEHATYVEPLSGAVLQFLPLPAGSSPSDNNIFTFTFPNAPEVLTGDVAWTNGRRTLPNMTIRHTCSQEDIAMQRQDGPTLCRLWIGSVYALSDGSADWIPDAGDPAPKGLLLPDFGDALIQWRGYYSVTENSAWDAFKFTGCAK